jgi:phospholipase/lecithinase/hemolysin
MANPETIVLKGHGIRKERPAGEAGIIPGHLLAVNSSGQVIKHNAAATNAQKMFAVENEVVGKEISEAYANGDNVLYEVLPTGAEVNAFVAANAAAIVIGDYLESAGDGSLRKAATDAATDNTQRNSLVAIALEAIDNSANGSQARIKVEIL